MRKENALQIIGIATFLIATSLTYGIVTPVHNTTNSSLDALTTKITNITTNTTNTTNTTDDTTSRMANDYHIMIAIAVGVVIAIVVVFFIGFWR